MWFAKKLHICRWCAVIHSLSKLRYGPARRTAAALDMPPGPDCRPPHRLTGTPLWKGCMELGGTLASPAGARIRPGIHLLLAGQPPGGAHSTSGAAQGTLSPPSCRDLGQLWTLLGRFWQVGGHVAWVASSGAMGQGKASGDKKSRHTPPARPAWGGTSSLTGSPAAGWGLPTSRTSHKV